MKDGSVEKETSKRKKKVKNTASFSSIPCKPFLVLFINSPLVPFVQNSIQTQQLHNNRPPTTMALSTKMQKLMDATVAAFCARLADKYEGMEVDDMMAMWKETAKNPKGPKKPKKKTAYMNFSQAMRTTIKAEHPEMSFGEVSTETSKRWKALSEEDKAKYAPTTTASTTASPTGSTASSSPESPLVVSPKASTKTKKVNKTAKAKKTKASPKKKVKAETSPKKTLADLKKECKEKGLSVKGLKKREEFEELLAACEPDPPSEDDEEEYECGDEGEEEEEMLA
jgi:hypothetical protein